MATAKTAALRYLKIRPRSVAELREKLEGKGFSAEEIGVTVSDLTATGLLDDRAFTKSWINYRLARPFGFRRIILELKNKGIDPEIIDQAVAEARENVSPEAAALDLAQRRWQRVPAGVELLKKKKRVLDFLLRRGFEPQIAIKVLKKLK
ncbi:MAG: regulatory protein RecX [Candidatus Omnitrophica bacterium]|nr:regulatory protein RecX [Candidatus Omnitrophota bacterium]MDE2223019.1 regulatory protein RecX [Candidatus Omnitrophota bacterium]